MQQQGEKDSGKNNENSTVVILNIDTDFMFHFRKLRKLFLSMLKIAQKHFPQSQMYTIAIAIARFFISIKYLITGQVCAG